MSKVRLVITAVVTEGRSQDEVARACGVSQGWVSRLVARYRPGGRGRVRAAVAAAEDLARSDPGQHGRADHRAEEGPGWAGPGRRAADDCLAPGPPSPHPGVTGDGQPLPGPGRLVTPDPAKRPKSSYLRFAAELPNECWQADFTHYPLANGTDSEVLTWLDDHSRYALRITAHRRVSGPIVVTQFRAAAAEHGIPASTLTDIQDG